MSPDLKTTDLVASIDSDNQDVGAERRFQKELHLMLDDLDLPNQSLTVS